MDLSIVDVVCRQPVLKKKIEAEAAVAGRGRKTEEE